VVVADATEQMRLIGWMAERHFAAVTANVPRLGRAICRQRRSRLGTSANQNAAFRLLTQATHLTIGQACRSAAYADADLLGDPDHISTADTQLLGQVTHVYRFRHGPHCLQQMRRFPAETPRRTCQIPWSGTGTVGSGGHLPGTVVGGRPQRRARSVGPTRGDSRESRGARPHPMPGRKSSGRHRSSRSVSLAILSEPRGQRYSVLAGH
jgi:hypothetical protein